MFGEIVSLSTVAVFFCFPSNSSAAFDLRGFSATNIRDTYAVYTLEVQDSKKIGWLIFIGKCGELYHAWMVWACINLKSYT